jgi:hypothetical protein
VITWEDASENGYALNEATSYLPPSVSAKYLSIPTMKRGEIKLKEVMI